MNMKNKILLLVCLLGMNVPMIGQTIKSSVHPIQYKQYDKVEIDIELVQKFNNPYVQEEIALDMLITTPSQKEQILPCYFVSKRVIIFLVGKQDILLRKVEYISIKFN